jgi:dihydrofolate reductase
MINIIVAVNESFQIGNSKTNTLLYRIKNDMVRFKQLTMNSYCVMGRLTYESLNSPLIGRTNVILTGNKNFKIDEELYDKYDIIVEHDFEKILNHYKFSGEQDKDFNIIGGSYLFAEGIHWADYIYLTMIHDSDNKNGDIYFPKFELSNFKEVSREKHYDEDSDLYYSYINYKRKVGI